MSSARVAGEQPQRGRARAASRRDRRRGPRSCGASAPVRGSNSRIWSPGIELGLGDGDVHGVVGRRHRAGGAGQRDRLAERPARCARRGAGAGARATRVTHRSRPWPASPVRPTPTSGRGRGFALARRGVERVQALAEEAAGPDVAAGADDDVRAPADLDRRRRPSGGQRGGLGGAVGRLGGRRAARRAAAAPAPADQQRRGRRRARPRATRRREPARPAAREGGRRPSGSSISIGAAAPVATTASRSAARPPAGGGGRGAAEVAGRLEPLLGRLGQRAGDHLVERRRARRGTRAEARRRLAPGAPTASPRRPRA